jgi:hypothetical protein
MSRRALLLTIIFALVTLSVSAAFAKSAHRHHAAPPRDQDPPTIQFQKDGKTYVIHDAKTIAAVRALVAPQEKLAAQQAALGEKQAALGAQQAKLGAKQAKLALAGADDAQQEKLDAQQEELDAQQEKLGAQQEELGRRQEQLARDAEEKLDRLFDDAIAAKIATPI